VCSLFNKIKDAAYYPKPWRISEVVLIPKIGKKDMSSVRSYRPIALVPVLGDVTVQGAFDAFLPRRFLKRMRQQGVLESLPDPTLQDYPQQRRPSRFPNFDRPLLD